MSDPFDFGLQPPADPQGSTGSQPSAEQPLSRRAAREAAAAPGPSRSPSRRGADAPTVAFSPETAVLAGAGGGEEPPKPPRGGLFAAFARHPRAWLFSALAVAFVLLGTGSVFAGIAFGSSRAGAETPSGAPTSTARATPSPVQTATALRTCSIADPAGAAALGTFSGTVINPATNEVLFDRAGTTGVATASVMKLLTSSVALTDLSPNYQFTTTVFAGSSPGTVVLVGGGDPTLTALPDGQQSVYKDAPHLDDLTAQVATAWKAAHPADPITSVVLDASMWNPSDNWDPSWPTSERTQGYQPLITALMVDGDRANPQAQNSPRSTDPVGAAGDAFVASLMAALGQSSTPSVSDGTVISGSQQLGQVKSQPISTLIGQMLPVSDNTLAEMMARVSSKVSGHDGSSGSLTSTYQSALSGYGLDTSSLVIKDGSGESNLDSVPPSLVAKLMVQINAGAAGGKNLDIIYNALPVAGKTGTLASRFTGPNAVARGAVNAKTGSIATAYALAGVVHAADGTALVFAFFAEGKLNSSAAMTALDTVTTAVFNCGNNLSNN